MKQQQTAAEHVAGGAAEPRKWAAAIKTVLGILFVGVGLAAILLLLSIVFPKQDAVRRQLEEEQAAKEQELLELELKKQSLQELSSLLGNRNYLIRYLREHQGYKFPGDIRIDLSDDNAVVPTISPAPVKTPEPTLIPTAAPTEVPETTPAATETGGN